MLFALEDSLENAELNDFFQCLIDAKLLFGQIEDLVHLIAVVGIIVLHVREVNARIRKQLFHLQIHGVDEHLIAKASRHFY